MFYSVKNENNDKWLLENRCRIYGTKNSDV